MKTKNNKKRLTLTIKKLDQDKLDSASLQKVKGGNNGGYAWRGNANNS